MGLSSSKTKQTTAPSTFSQPYITAGAGALGDAFNQAQGVASNVSADLAGRLPQLGEMAFSPSAGLTAATDYNTNMLTTGPASNPQLDAMIALTGDNVANRVNSTFGAAGRTGSGAQTYALGKALADSETGYRYNDYTTQVGLREAAANRAGALDAARYSGIAPYLAVAQGAVGIPQQTAGAYAQGLGALLGNYNTTTGTQNMGLGGLLGAGLAGWASGGFKGV